MKQKAVQVRQYPLPHSRHEYDILAPDVFAERQGADFHAKRGIALLQGFLAIAGAAVSGGTSEHGHVEARFAMRHPPRGGTPGFQDTANLHVFDNFLISYLFELHMVT